MSGTDPNAVRVPVYIDPSNILTPEQIARILRRRTRSAALAQQDPTQLVQGVQSYATGGKAGQKVPLGGVAEAEDRRQAEQREESIKELRRSRKFRRRLREARERRRREEIAGEDRARALEKRHARERVARIRREGLSPEEQAVRDISRKRATDFWLGGVTPIAMGLLGPAGFPFLNIGFAAMQGGHMGALRAGGAMVIGEGLRILTRAVVALDRFQKSLIKAAESVNFVTDAYQEQRGGLEGMKTVMGGIATIPAIDRMKQYNAMLAVSSGELANLNLALGNFKTSLMTMAFQVAGAAFLSIPGARAFLQRPGGTTYGLAGGLIGMPFQGFLKGTREIDLPVMAQRERMVSMLEEMLANMERSTFQASLSGAKEVSDRMVRLSVSRSDKEDAFREATKQSIIETIRLLKSIDENTKKTAEPPTGEEVNQQLRDMFGNPVWSLQ